MNNNCRQRQAFKPMTGGEQHRHTEGKHYGLSEFDSLSFLYELQRTNERVAEKAPESHTGTNMGGGISHLL